MPKKLNASEGGWHLEGLSAAGACPEHGSKLALFGQFVGDWDIVEWRSLEKDGTWSRGRGELHWRWILEGRAVQDVWETINEKTGEPVPLGTTVRFYDPKLDAWQSTWISPVNGVTRLFIGRPAGSEIVLEGKNARGTPIHWIFSDITAESFRWRAEELRAAPSDWVMNEEMRIVRRPESARAPASEPSGSG